MVFRCGDGLNFASDKWDGIGIRACTLGRYSHTAYLANYPAELDSPAVFESTSLSPLPCMIQRKLVEGVQCHGIEETIQNYPGKVWHMPLKVPLTDDQALALSEWSIDMCKRGTGYDWRAAASARILAFGWARRWIARMIGCTGDANLVQCAELKAYAYGHDEVGLIDPLANPGLWSPVRLERRLQRLGVDCKGVRIK